MASDLDRIVARVESMPRATADLEPAEPRLVMEPGMSRYQRKSAHLRDRVILLELIDDDVTVDLTGD